MAWQLVYTVISIIPALALWSYLRRSSKRLPGGPTASHQALDLEHSEGLVCAALALKCNMMTCGSAL